MWLFLLQLLCAVSSFHTDEGVATPDSSLDCVCNCLFYLALRMHNLLHFTVLLAIFAKLVISCWSTTDLNLWYHSLKQLGQQHNFCLALSFPFYLLIFPDTSKFHTTELCLLQCYAILIAGALLMFHRIVVLSSSGSDSARRDKATIICLSVSDSVLINMEEHPGDWNIKGDCCENSILIKCYADKGTWFFCFEIFSALCCFLRP